MYADRYARPTLKPGSLALAGGFNALMLAGLIYSVPNVVQIPEKSFVGVNIPLQPPPPPLPKEQPKPVSHIAAPREILTAPIREVPTNTLHAVDVLPFPPAPITEPGPVLDASDTGGGALNPPAPPALVDASVDPHYADAFQPEYPVEQRRLGNTGRVVVRVRIGVDGRVKEVQAVDAVNTAFLDATRRQALSRWRFRPATRAGVPIEAWRTMTVRFVLDE